MEATVSTAFIYAILGGVLSVFSLIYYQKTKDPEFKRKPIYYAGIFFIVANIIYYMYLPNDITGQLKVKNVFSPNVLEMKTGQPTF
jgi:hypothetical protein|tara:strand:+ start:12774 stop:13031 length:258 start_codon:yes stop_codon:yes gene_type:complete